MFEVLQIWCSGYWYGYLPWLRLGAQWCIWPGVCSGMHANFGQWPCREAMLGKSQSAWEGIITRLGGRGGVGNWAARN